MTAPAIAAPTRASLIDRLLDWFFAAPKPRAGTSGGHRRRETVCDLRAGLEAMAHSPVAPPITEYAHYIIARHYGGGRG